MSKPATGPDARAPEEAPLADEGRAGAVRRTVAVLVVYAPAAALVYFLGMLLGRVLVLPPMFASMLVAGLWVGAGVAALMAWHYPSIAVGRGADESDDDG